MLKGALSSNGNINVDIAMSLFDKQIVPILTYGSTFWGINDNFTRFYIKDVDENINTLNDLNNKLHCKSIISFKRVGKKSNTPRNIIAEADSYESKIFLLNKFKYCDEFHQTIVEDNLEKVHTKFCKFALNINKYASNHLIRAELGRFPVKILTDLKLIKYWHRLENLKEDSILKESYNLCKTNDHNWYINICNFMKKNGLGYACNSANTISENLIVNSLNEKLHDQYIQTWDEKCSTSDKYEILSLFKKSHYKRSSYLNNVYDIYDRKNLTKLRLSCSKLNGHRYLRKTESTNCPSCNSTLENTYHFLMVCEKYKEIRDNYLSKLSKIFSNFKQYSEKQKLLCMLNLKPFISNSIENYENILKEFTLLCISYINELFKARFD